MYILLPFNFIYVSKPSNFEGKSLGLKTIDIASCNFPIDIVTLPRLLLRYIDSPMYCYTPN